MKKLFYLLGLALIMYHVFFLSSCNKNSETLGVSRVQNNFSNDNDTKPVIVNSTLSMQRLNEINEMMLSKDFKFIHDKYSLMICDSVQKWRRYDMLDSIISNNVWDMIINGLEGDLKLSKEEIITIANTINMSKETFYNFEPKSWISQVPQNWQSFYSDVTDSVRECEDLTEENILILLEEKRLYWRNILDPSLVDKSIDIAKSSYTHWINDVDCLVENELVLRLTDKQKAGIGLAEDDIGGAIWGGIFGGLAGACLGAVGGTLVGAIKLAIHGY